MLPEMASIALSSLVAPLSKSVIKSAIPWMARSRSTDIVVQGDGNQINLENLTTEQAKQLLKTLRDGLPTAEVAQEGVSIDRIDAASVEIRTVDPAKEGIGVRIKEAKFSGDIDIKGVEVGPKGPRKTGKTPARKPSHSSARITTTDVVTESGAIVVSPVFKLVFLTIVFLTVASAIAAAVMAFVGDGTQPNQQAMFESMNTSWKLGLGAIFGLLGGKAT